MLYKFLCAYTVLEILILHVYGQENEASWMEPDAWGQKAEPTWRWSKDREADEVLSSCPVCNNYAATTDEGVALTYYKKFILTLFNRKKLQYDEKSNLYQRALQFSLLPSQLEKLEQLQDPRDIDSILTEIITKARTGGTFAGCVDSNSSIELILDIVKDLWQLIKTNEVRFILLVAAVILCAVFVHRRYNIGFVSLILIGVFLFGYLLNYLECNRKLELDDVIEFMTEDVAPAKTSWYRQLLNQFADNRNMAQIKKIRKSRSFKLHFCRPDHVLMMYANEIILKQFEIVVEKLSTTISKISIHLPYPFKWIVPIILPFVVFILFRDFMKSLYKSILNVSGWSNWGYGHRQDPHHPQLQQNQLQISTEDRISGENLKLLLNAVKKPNVLIVNDKCIPLTSAEICLSSASGVEEIYTESDHSSLNSSATSSKTDILSSKHSVNVSNHIAPGENAAALKLKKAMLSDINTPSVTADCE